MGAVIILGQELLQKKGQRQVILPSFVLEPLFESAYKALSNAIRLGSMTSDKDMYKICLSGQQLKSISPKVNAPVRNQELQFKIKF